MNNLSRHHKLIERIITDFSLLLDGACVLTEATSGNYFVTPFIAALAGAKVIAVTKDSKYGSARDIISINEKVAHEYHVTDKITFLTKLEPNIIADADIVTNLGFVRPINRQFIEAMKPTAVIPLMWEPWEFRKEDIDLTACINKNIPVVGTNEQDARVRTFEYVGSLVLKKLFEMGLEVNGNRIALVGSGVFLEMANRTLENAGAITSTYDTSILNDPVELSSVTEAVVLLEHKNPTKLIGHNALICNGSKFWNEMPVLHISGSLDGIWLQANHARLIPQEPASFGHMSFTTADIGPLPVIKLHTAGLRVGESMWRWRTSNKYYDDFKEYVLANSPAVFFD